MRALLLTLSALILVSFATPSFAQTAEELAAAEKVLVDGANRFRAVVAGISAEKWSKRADGFPHTIAEEAEHLCFSENELQQMIVRAKSFQLLPNEAAALKGQEKIAHDVLLDEDSPAEFYAVKNKIATKDEALEYFGAANRKLMTLFRQSKDLGYSQAKHPSKKIGMLSGLQWFYYIAYHRERHIRQIEAIAKSLK